MTLRRDKFLCMDLEMTCWDGSPPSGQAAEVLEIGIVEVAAGTFETLREERFLVRPVRSDVSPFCTELTGITPEEVRASGRPFGEVVRTLTKRYGPGGKRMVTFGDDWTAFDEACRDSAVSNPLPAVNVLDLGAMLSMSLGGSANPSLPAALELYGLEFEGRRHRALDDTRNTARLAAAMGRLLAPDAKNTLEAEVKPTPPPSKRSIVQRGLPPDPLGYDVGDLRLTAGKMADDAINGRHREALDAEVDRAVRFVAASSTEAAFVAGNARERRLLIADSTPLSLLAMLGTEALDWLFVPGLAVWVTDIVMADAKRGAIHGGDGSVHEETLKSWLDKNGHRIYRQTTSTQEEYSKAMRVWEQAGKPEPLKPSLNRGEASILDVLEVAEIMVEAGQAVMVLVDERRARAAFRLHETPILSLMGTRTFLKVLADEYTVSEAEAAWTTIKVASDNARDASEDDLASARPFR